MKTRETSLLLLMSVLTPLLVWAGGYENGDLKFYDPRSSEGKSGENTPREYFIPQVPDYDRHDPAEFDDYGKEAYTPYAPLQIPQPIRLDQTIIAPGYYLVKLVVNTPNPGSGGQQPSRKTKRKEVFPAVGESGAQISLMIKQAGNIVLTMPVVSSQSADKSLKKNDVRATLSTEADDPVNPEFVYLTYCVRNQCYKSPGLSPALLQ